MSVTIGQLERYKGKNFFINILPVTFENDFIYKEDWKQLSGNVTIENESKTVNGADTKFTEELTIGDTIKIDGADFGEGEDETKVTAIENDTELTVEDESIASTGGASEADAFKVCPEAEKFIPVDIKKDIGMQVVFSITGTNEDGFYFLYDKENGVIRAFQEGGVEVEALDPDENDNGEQLKDTEAIIVAMGR